MSESSFSNPVPHDCRYAFAARPPSVAWETLQLPTTPPRTFWVWFKPQHLPTAIIVQIPPADSMAPVTVRYIVQMLGVDPVCVPMCSLFGFSFPGQNGAALYFDQAITETPAGADPNIVFYIDPPPMQSAPAYFAESDYDEDSNEYSEGQIDEIFLSMERDWKGSLQAERQLQSLQKQLLDLQTRLSMMNRDLNVDERLHSDRSDQDDWQEARRALRDAATRLARYIKEMDSGETVYAGKKLWFDKIRKTYVVPRRPFDGLDSARQEFEIYRSTMQNLVTRMQAAYHQARQEGEIRAQQVLNRIAAKVASSKNGR
ncbi:MAG: hypothetical protein O3B13_16770 [Planctomycetota bacterium]|nr:hypothetical protein [Planctomycetota bacterium]MDA1164747.1 hypothetical protein [Planctomycetota bacterium]